MKLENVYMGTMISSWMQDKNIKYITFSVTEDCNLMCKYCYFTHKNNKNKLTFDVAKKAIDYILSEEKFLIHDGVVWDFIGGEPTLEMDLIDKISDYILYKMYTLNHKWLYCYRFMVGTNGLLYSSPKLQNYINKHSSNVHVGITIDGSKEKHDLSRIKKDGSGSYDDVVKNLPLWFDQLGTHSTKSTFAHADLPYLKDSIINLWNIGIYNVMANVVFENVWEENDPVIFEEQLKALADYVIDNELWNKYSVRFFSPEIGYPIDDEERRINHCGTGNMMAIDHTGNFYPCIRFMDSALNNHKGRVIGNIKEGIDTDKIRAFNALSYDAQSLQKCIECDVSRGCSWCTGLNFDDSKEGTIFERQIHQCEMHKANVRANNYFWKKYEKITGCVSPLRYNRYKNNSSQNKYLYILKNNRFSFCNVESKISDFHEMDIITYEKAIEFCDKNNFIPVHIGFEKEYEFGYYIGDYTGDYSKNEFTIDVITHENINYYDEQNISGTVIYKINSQALDQAFNDINKICFFSNVSKINIKIINYESWGRKELQAYRLFLEQLSEFLLEEWMRSHFVQIDLLTNTLFTDNRIFCDAGTRQITVAPNGDLYPCSAYFFNGDKKIGNIFDNNVFEFESEKQLLMCKKCKVINCNKCSFLNRKKTLEKQVPFEAHCVKANLEYNASVDFMDKLKKEKIELPFEIKDGLNKTDELDPLLTLRGDSFVNNKLHTI